MKPQEIRENLSFGVDEISEKDKGRLGRQAAAATEESPLELVVGSCPDYSNDGVNYNFEHLGEDVPLLTKLQLQANEGLVGQLSALEVPFRFSVLLADVEATDSYFCDRYCDGDYDEFMRRCEASIEATQEYIRTTYALGNFASSSFFRYFGEDDFKDTQSRYEDMLAKAGNPLERKIDNDSKYRSRLYEKLYGPVARNPDFCRSRTRRTTAQYLTIGRLLSGNGGQGVMISHDTTNAGVFQDINKMEPGGNGNLPVVPVIKRKVRVYE